MEQNSILTKLQIIFRNFFKNDTIELIKDSSANDIDGWNSLNHMSLIGEIERDFNIEFEFFELMDFRNVGDLIKAISIKINK
jgi:acyl carrier protein|tara:strand:+ start:175 stop:420 length:246 start_codon:yes stop_codon:yes gene_type:complete